MTAEDRDYVDRALSGDRTAFDGLVRKYNRMAGAIAYAIAGDFAAAEDIVQDSFLKAYQSLPSLRAAEKFKVWLAGIVRSRAVDWLRKRKGLWGLPFTQAFPQGEEDVSSRAAFHGPPADELYAQEEVRAKILEAIRGLPEEDRVAVTLKHMEGLSYREIAELTGATVSSVESRLFRARQALRKKLEQILK